MRTEGSIAPGGQLRERHAARRTSAGVVDAAAGFAASVHLDGEQACQVARMEGIPYLVAAAVETDITKQTAARDWKNPCSVLFLELLIIA